MRKYDLQEAARSFTPTNRQRYNSANEFFKRVFGQKVYKLSFDAGFTCPNRDGTLGNRGCIFCSEGGSGDFAEKITPETIEQSIDKAKQRICAKTHAEKFIAYFQSYTNTYAKAAELERLFVPVISRDDICALSIATRPDCIESNVYELIAQLCKIKPVFVELGLQTVCQKSIEFIRRGYKTEIFDSAVKKLKAAGANVIAHVILGLPEEDKDQMLKTVKHVAKAKADGIKLQLLHVLKDTDLAEVYSKGVFETLSLEQYTDILCEAVNILPPEIVIHRLTGDAPKKLLIEPQWSANKKAVLNEITKTFNERNVIQGSKLNQ